MKQTAGFTLLEILVSMTIFSFIAALLMSSFLSFQGIGQRLDQKMKMHQELRNLETLIREDIRNVVYLKGFATNNQEQAQQQSQSGIHSLDLSEAGEQKDRLDLQIHSRGKFFTSFKRSLNPELFEVSYYFGTDKKGVKGFYRRESYFLDGPIGSGGEAIVHRLSKRLKEFNLTFYGPQDKPQLAWVSTRKNALPKGVEVKLTLQNEQGETMVQTFNVNLHPSMGPSVTWGTP